jgi:AraC-like DNA-binding protein
MILREMPDLLPRPETPRNAAFRREFYRRWGRENSVVCGSTSYAEYNTYRQTLSVKTVEGGREHYQVGRRRLTVTDETWLILNENREYSSVLEGFGQPFSFCLFFRPGMANEIVGAARKDYAQALEAGPEPSPAPIEFGENLRPHDKGVTSVVRFIRRHVAAGVVDPNWYEEQFNFLLGRMLRAEQALIHLPERFDCVRAGKRVELIKRVGWATDFIHSNLHRDIALEDVAGAAHLSQYHFLRVFRTLHGMTPMTYLRTQRTQRALALLKSSDADISEIASQVGLSRVTLWRLIQSTTGAGPLKTRKTLTNQAPLNPARLAAGPRSSRGS